MYKIEEREKKILFKLNVSKMTLLNVKLSQCYFYNV